MCFKERVLTRRESNPARRRLRSRGADAGLRLMLPASLPGPVTWASTSPSRLKLDSEVVFPALPES